MIFPLTLLIDSAASGAIVFSLTAAIVSQRAARSSVVVVGVFICFC